MQDELDIGLGAVYKNKLMGIYTFNPFVDGADAPVGYAKISHYVNWIYRTIANDTV